VEYQRKLGRNRRVGSVAAALLCHGTHICVVRLSFPLVAKDT
jgi:hypothetical protein